MKNKQFLIALLLSINGLFYSQNNKETEDYLIWTIERKLNWKDFKSIEKTKNIGVAQTAASIEIKPFRNKNKKYDYKVLSKFYKNKSWTETENSEVLIHEQLHFDIAELYARKMRKEIVLVKSKNKIVKEEDYRRIHQFLFREYLMFQNKYDIETDFSKKTETQEIWNDSILKKLINLNDYALKN
ncbi:hypothetical protein BST83_05495 [Polaribacter filamentus]|jgi:hypothetical protein|uniref:DUF922 domain-containing protein n=1 Tax=Polaribacter filamentus TaxID=53483 RepID=A0A2S7KVJ1_9FLAO|nr:hypothetical protein [Polaribacter filamentus]PQB06672.1 hypothetical protein BST83_05495 [Polaribacter filamentus]